MASEGYTVSLCALVGLSGFVVGAYFQHEVTIRNLISLVRTDPYAYHNRRKLYNVLSLFKGDIESRAKANFQQHTSEKVLGYLISPLFSVVSFFLIIRKGNPSMQPNLMDVMKYGFPSMENIRVHREYVVSYDARNGCPHWVCEHLTKNYKKLIRTVSGEYLNLRFNDVYELSNGSSRSGQAFKSQAWHKLEDYITELTNKYSSVYAYSGPLYLPHCKNDDWMLEYEIIEWQPVPVPSHFFKVLIVDSQLPHCSPYMEGYIIPNRMISTINDLRRYLSDIEEIERYSGLKFISGLRHSVLFKNENYVSESNTKFDEYDVLEKKLASINNSYVKEII